MTDELNVKTLRERMGEDAVYVVAERAAMHPTHLSRIISRGRCRQATTLRLAKALGCRRGDLLKDEKAAVA